MQFWNNERELGGPVGRAAQWSTRDRYCEDSWTLSSLERTVLVNNNTLSHLKIENEGFDPHGGKKTYDYRWANGNTYEQRALTTQSLTIAYIYQALSSIKTYCDMRLSAKSLNACSSSMIRRFC